MIIQRLFSKTWTHITDPAKRTKKAKELKEKKQIVDKRLDEINAERKEGLEKSAKGENVKFVYDKKGAKIKDPNGNFWTNPVTAEEVEKKAKDKMKDLKEWMNSFQDTTKRTPKPKVKEVEKSVLEKATEKGKEILKNPKTKKWGYLGAGALGGSLAVDGIDAGVKRIKDKKKEKEAKEQILGKRKK